MVYEVNSGVYSSRAIFCTVSTKHLLSMSPHLFFFFFFSFFFVIVVFYFLFFCFGFDFLFPCISFGPHSYKRYETRDDSA